MVVLRQCFLALFLSAAANASFLDNLKDNLRDPADPTCTLTGSTSKDVCDGTSAADGSSCVWCTVSAYGLCVDVDQAQIIEQSVPMADCDGGSGADDDAPNNDDDDNTPTDDDTPSDYWTCLKDSSDKDSCAAAGCAWCDTKGGYGLCMDKKAAESANTGDWFTCDVAEDAWLEDPMDTTCLQETLEMDEGACKATKDQDGQPCEWCTVGSTPLCLNGEQADIATQLGGDCDAAQVDVLDPLDTSCVQATLEMDEDACKSTQDQDGKACEWCMVGTTPLCLNDEQAEIAEQLGGSCDAGAAIVVEEEAEVSDPLDTACLQATLQMDEDACKATQDSDGNACEWCNVNQTPLCLNAEQAQIAEQLGGSCDAVVAGIDLETA